ncbi:MAG TPA: protein-disulfide reductase DsbD domain-containing protein, partial [Acinetobacter sp.]|nr:protein-disulfide reductase DsbD domain-containing protein [Acinetobacter sp.]
MEKSLLLSKSYARSMLLLCSSLLFFCSTLLHAQSSLLSAEEAFPIQIESVSAQEVQLHWNIPEHYYLYQHKFEVRQGQHILPLKLPKAEDLHDDNYGQTQVYYQQVQFKVPTQASQTYQVTWQGCAKDRICYPPQVIEFKTDADGLVALQNQTVAPKRLLDLSANSNTLSAENPDALDQKLSAPAQQTAQDQHWSTQLAERSP